MSDLHWRTASILLQDNGSLSARNGVIPNSLPKQTCRLSLLSNDPIGSMNNDYLFRNTKLKMTKHVKNTIPNTFLPPSSVISVLPRNDPNNKDFSAVSSLTKKRKAEEHALSEHSMPPLKSFGSEEVWREPTVATVLDTSRTSFLPGGTMAHLLRTSRPAIVDLPVPCPTFSNSQIIVPFFTSVTNSTVNPAMNTIANDSTTNKANNDGDYRIVVGEHITSLSTMYEVITFLGRGTFGQVVKARCLTTQTLVAIKILKSHPSYQRQGNVEISILQALSKEDTDAHNLVRAIECFQHCNHTCLVFELLEQNLYDYLKAHKFRPLSLREIRPITQQVLVALCKLKELGFIHADLKPENIMLVNEGGRDSTNNVRFRVKVIDFGSACHQSKAVPNTYLQSRYYRAPEILLGLPFNESIDMWSLGCVVAELYLGWPLYPGSVEYDQMRYIVETQGLPPLDMLLRAPKNNRYFKIDSQNNYRLKRTDEYTAETGQRTKEARKFKFSSLTAIEDAHRGGGNNHMGNDGLTTARLLERGLSMISDEQQTEAFVDALDRREFVTLLCSMLILPSSVRITPDSALQHPFITLMHLQPYLDCSQRARDSLYMMQVCRHSNYQSPKPPVLTPCARTPLLEMRMSSASLQSTGIFPDADQIPHRPTVGHLLSTQIPCTHDNQIIPPGFDSGNYFVTPANYLGVGSSTASTLSVFQPNSHFTSSSNIHPVSLSAVLAAPQLSLGTADVINMCMVNRSHPSASNNTTVQDPLYTLNAPIVNTMEVTQLAKAHQQLASMAYGQIVNGVNHSLTSNPTVITNNRVDPVLVRPTLTTYNGSDVRPTNVLLSVTSAMGNHSHSHRTINAVSNMNTTVPHLLYPTTSITSNGYSTKTTQQPCPPALLYVAPAQLTDVVNSSQSIPQPSQPLQPFNLVAFLPSAHSTSASVLSHPSFVDINATARGGVNGVSHAGVATTAGATYAYLPSRNVNLFVSPTEQRVMDNHLNKERYLVNAKETMSVLTLNNNVGVGVNGCGSTACYVPATMQQQTDCGVRDSQLLFQSGRDPEPNEQINLSTLMTQQLENCLPFGSTDPLRDRNKKAIPIMRVQPILKQISNASHLKEVIPSAHVATSEINGNENQQSVVLLPQQVRVLPQQQADNTQTSGFYLLGPSDGIQRNLNNGGAPLLINTAQTRATLGGSLLSHESSSQMLHQQQPREKAFLKAAAAAYSMVFQLVNPSVNSNSNGTLPGSTTTGHITPPMT